MKTAISIPDKVFKSAEELANKLGKSRSQLYTEAIKNYLVKHEGSIITEQLDDIYSKENSDLDPKIQFLQDQSLPEDKW